MWRKSIAAGVLVVSVVIAGIGFLHTRTAQKMFGIGCPLGFDHRASAEEKQQALLSFSAAHRGEHVAGGRPAMGFVLDQTSKDDVIAWAIAHGVTCSVPRSGPDITCEQVPASLLSDASSVDVRSLWLEFGANNRLTSVIAVRKDVNATAITSTYDAVRKTLTATAGPATSVTPDTVLITDGALQQTTAEYRFQNYYALMRATNMSGSFLLTEEYRSLVR